MKKGIKKYLFYSVFIHLLLISALLLSLYELGHLSLNDQENGGVGLTHISILNQENSAVNIAPKQNKLPPKTEKQFINTRKNLSQNSQLSEKKSTISKNQYKITKNSSNISVEENKDDDSLSQSEHGGKIKKEFVKGGNENNDAVPLKSSAKPEYGINPKPEYPIAARRRGYEGEVIFNVQVLNDGNVGEMEIVKTSGYAVLDNSAHAALKKWKFVPGKFNGKYVLSWVKVPILFRLNDI